MLTIERILLLFSIISLIALTVYSLSPSRKFSGQEERYLTSGLVEIAQAIELENPVRLTLSVYALATPLNITLVLPHEKPVVFLVNRSRIVLDARFSQPKTVYGPDIASKFVTRRYVTVFLNYTEAIIDPKPMVRLVTCTAPLNLNCYGLLIRYLRAIQPLRKGLTLHPLNMTTSSLLRIYLRRVEIRVIIDGEEAITQTLEPPAVLYVSLIEELWICD